MGRGKLPRLFYDLIITGEETARVWYNLAVGI